MCVQVGLVVPTIVSKFKMYGKSLSKMNNNKLRVTQKTYWVTRIKIVEIVNCILKIRYTKFKLRTN